MRRAAQRLIGLQRSTLRALRQELHPWQQPLLSQQPAAAIATAAQQHHWRLHCAQDAWSTHTFSTATTQGGSGDKPEAELTDDEPPGTLQSSLDKLVAAASELVNEGKVEEAVAVLQQGVDIISPAFPNSPELGELHNQAALLNFFMGALDQAATSAQASLDITSAAYGEQHPLTARRRQRLGTIRFGQGRLSEARGLLQAALQDLPPQDYARSEAHLYLGFIKLAGAGDPGAVAAMTDDLREHVAAMRQQLGGRNMVLKLALEQHGALLYAGMDAGFPLGEALFRQHVRLKEADDPGSPDLGVTLLQLATYYYANDMLQDAGPICQRAGVIMRGHFPEDHDLVMLCKHRMGMICAAMRDSGTAAKLLEETRAHYEAQRAGHELAREAQVGLALVALRQAEGLAAQERRARQEQLLAGMKDDVTALAVSLGSEHMLVQGASRYYAQASVMAGRA